VLGVHHCAICTADVERSLRFWRDGLGLRELFDHTFIGDWPELFGAKSDRLRSIFLGDPQSPDSGIVELVELAGADAASPTSSAPRHGFFLLSLQRDVDATLPGLAALGFTDGVRRITMPAPAGKTVPMAVIAAPDGVLVELIGPAV
jgi:catechol 2,3-dioxygenase-like lactoylglutathione lyase family enzyme